MPLISTVPRRSNTNELPIASLASLGDLDSTSAAMRFHARGGVHGVAPDIVEKLAGAYDAGHRRTGVDADAHCKLLMELGGKPSRRGEHVERHVGDRGGMAFACFRHAAGNHIGVADGLDFLKAMLLCELVELGKDPVQEPHQFVRSQPAGTWREVDDVGEQNGHRVELVGDDLVRVLLKSRGDRGRHQVEKQVLGTIIFAFQLAFGRFRHAQRQIDETGDDQRLADDGEAFHDRRKRWRNRCVFA